MAHQPLAQPPLAWPHVYPRQLPQRTASLGWLPSWPLCAGEWKRWSEAESADAGVVALLHRSCLCNVAVEAVRCENPAAFAAHNAPAIMMRCSRSQCDPTGHGPRRVATGTLRKAQESSES